MGLDFVQPSDVRKLNALIYGPPGTGKTVSACSAPGPILYGNSDSPTRLHKGRDMYPDTIIDEYPIVGLESLTKFRTFAGTKEALDKYKTVVIDPIGTLYGYLTQEKMDAKGVEMPSQPMYGESGIHVERLCRFFCDSPYNFVMICHEGVDKDELSGVRFTAPDTGGRANPRKLSAMADIVAYSEVLTRKDGSTTFGVRMYPSANRIGKCDLSIFNELEPNNVGSWIKKYNGE